jgi:hypothetical protein
MLAGHNTYSRVSADLKRQMDEALQSQSRYDLYLKQLDYEKVFSLGSHPLSKKLFTKHSISWVTGIDKSSSSGFQFNPALTKVIKSNDVNVYQVNNQISSTDFDPSRDNWLLKTSTLINDIGDLEDTYKHLPVSLRATRLSNPRNQENLTYRTSTAPIIPLYFNINDYVSLLWNKEKNNYPDTSVELYISALPDSYPLTISTQNHQYTLTAAQPSVKIPASHTPINNEGFIIINISNPQQTPVSLDLVALGLSRTP